MHLGSESARKKKAEKRSKRKKNFLRDAWEGMKAGRRQRRLVAILKEANVLLADPKQADFLIREQYDLYAEMLKKVGEGMARSPNYDPELAGAGANQGRESVDTVSVASSTGSESC